MSILSTLKKGYISIKTSKGYQKFLPRTLANLVIMTDNTTVEDKITKLNTNLTNLNNSINNLNSALKIRNSVGITMKISGDFWNHDIVYNPITGIGVVIINGMPSKNVSSGATIATLPTSISFARWMPGYAVVGSSTCQFAFSDKSITTEWSLQAGQHVRFSAFCFIE